jgi:hypothetical protein
MQNEDEPNLLRVLDETEAIRRERAAELNAVGWGREILEGTYGKVYSTDELRAEFEVMGFYAPLVVVKSKADGSLGSFEFQHAPRFFFNYVRDEQ